MFVRFCYSCVDVDAAEWLNECDEQFTVQQKEINDLEMQCKSYHHQLLTFCNIFILFKKG